MRYGSEWELLDGDLSELGDGEGRPSDLALARVVVGGVVSASVRPSVLSLFGRIKGAVKRLKTAAAAVVTQSQSGVSFCAQNEEAGQCT